MDTETCVRNLVGGAIVVAGMMVLRVEATTLLTLPPVNAMSAGQFGDFPVYSLDLLQQCQAAGDDRCQPAAFLPVDSSPGAIDDQLVVYQGNNGNDNDDATGPLTSVAVDGVDNPFRSTGGVGDQFVMSAANEPGNGAVVNMVPEFAGDRIGTWDASLLTVLNYLTDPLTGQVHDLVFLFDNNEIGNSSGQSQLVWGQVSVFDTAGSQQFCFELNSSTSTGCIDTGVDAPDPLTDYVPVIGNFCVDIDSGESYNIGGAENVGDCAAGLDALHPAGGYFVNNNLGQNIAEFAAFSEELNANKEQWAANGWILSIDLRLDDLTDGTEQLWLCDRCTLTAVEIAIAEAPLPGAAWLFGAGLLGMGGMRIRRFRRRGRAVSSPGAGCS